MDINGKIQTYLKKRKKLKRSLPFHAMLSLLVTICVVSNLIMPAISMSIEMSPLSLHLSNAGIGPARPTENGYFESIQTLIPDKAENFGDVGNQSQSLSFTLNSNPAGTTDESGNITINAGGLGEVAISMVMTYTMMASTVSTDDPCIYYQLPDGITIQDETYVGPNMKVFDDSYPGPDHVAGYFTISADGLIVIQFLDDYISWLKTNGSTTYTGSIEFTGTIDRAETADGDQNLNIGGKEINVIFNDTVNNIDKTAAVSDNDNGEVTIQWTVTVTDAGFGLGGWTVKDEKFATVGSSAITVDPAGLGEFTADGSSYVFYDECVSPDDKTVTFTYSETISVSELNERYANNNLNVSNTASVSKDALKNEVDRTVQLSQTTISKNGVQDYQSSGQINNKIDWTVDVENPYGASLKDYVIYDAMLSGDSVVDGSITLKDADGYDVGFNNNGDGTITITGDASKVTLSYQTNAVVGDNKNTAKIKYPGASDYGPTSEKNVGYDNPFSVSKKGTYDAENNQVIWEVTVKSSSYGMTLDGIELSDARFSGLSKINFVSAKRENWESLSLISGQSSDTLLTVGNYDASYGTAKLENGKVVFDCVDGKGFHEFVFTYVTTLGDDEIAAGSVSNEVSDQYGHIGKDTVELTSPYTLNKIGTYDAANNQIVWKVTVENTTSNSSTLKGVVLEDDAFASMVDGSLKVTYAVHNYTTLTQMSSEGNVITVGANSTPYGTLTLDTSITTDHPVPTISIANSSDTTGIKKLEFEYRTQLTTEEMLAGNKVENAIGGNKWSSDDEVKAEATPYNPFELYKSGTYNAEKGVVVWEIHVKTASGGTVSLDDVVLTDPAFDGLTAENINVTYAAYNGDSSLTKLSTSADNVVRVGKDSSTYGTLTIEGQQITIDAAGTNSLSEIKFTYTTTPDSAVVANQGNVSNGVGDNRGHHTGDVFVQLTNPYTLDKQGSYDPESGRITWTVTVKNSGNYAGASLDGTVLYDAAFANMMAGSWKMVSANYDGTWLSQSSVADNVMSIGSGDTTYGTMTLDTSITDDHPTPSITFANSSDTTGLKEVTFTYQTVATAQEIADKRATNQINSNRNVSDEANVDVLPRSEFDKTYTNTTTSDTVYGNSDKDSRFLNWALTMTKDDGYATSEPILVDQLNTSNGLGQHYITKEQADAIVISGKVSESGDYNVMAADPYYTITFYDAEGNQITDEDWTAEDDTAIVAKKFTVAFNEAVDTQGYRHLKVEYATTADVSGIEVGLMANGVTQPIYDVYTNTATFAGEPKTPGGFTFTRWPEDYVETTNLYIEKAWPDTKFPVDKIQVQVYQREEGSDQWIEYGDPIEMTKKDDWTSSWNYTLESLPKTTSDRTKKYYYKAVELTEVEGYEATYNYDENGVTGDYLSIKITNTPSEKVNKTALDKDGKVLDNNASLTTGDLITATINGKKCYVIGWQIKPSKNGMTLTDTLPSGFSFCTEAPYQPFLVWNGNNGTQTLSSSETVAQNTYTYTASTNEVRFNQIDYADSVTYYTYIPVDDFDSNFSDTVLSVGVENVIKTPSGNEEKANIIISPENSFGTDGEDLLDKKAHTATPGLLEYTVLVNPEGKTLSNDGFINITDDFDFTKFLSYTGNGNYRELTAEELAALNANLKSIKVNNVKISYDSNGNLTYETVGDPLSGNDYSYTVDYKPVEVTNHVYKFTAVSGQTNEWECTDCQPGDQITLVLNFANGVDGNGVYVTWTDANGWSYTNITHDSVVVGDTTITYSFTVPNSATKLRIKDWNSKVTSIESATAVRTTLLSTTTLNVSVPDETPLLITYEYEIKGIELNLPEYFEDTNGNGVCDAGEQYNDDNQNGKWDEGEWYNDTNGNGKYDAPETFIDTNLNGVWDNGDKFSATNHASFDTGNASASDSADQTEFIVVSALAYVSANNPPKLEKVDTNDYVVKLQDASFKLARYNSETGLWEFAVNETTENRGGVQVTVPVWENNGTTSTTAGNEIADGSHAFTIGSISIDFETETLYKLVEVSVPPAYEGSNLVEEFDTMLTQYLNQSYTGSHTAYLAAFVGAYPGVSSATFEQLLQLYLKGIKGGPFDYFFDNFQSTFYFAYTSGAYEAPAGFSEAVMTVPENGTLNVSNSKLIDVSALKVWDDASLTESQKANASVQVQLYWSTAKKGVGFPANNFNLATAKNLGLIGEFENPKTITGGETVTWEDLPSGVNGKPIYYYVKEVSYTIDGVTYNLNGDAYTGTDAEGKPLPGDYKPIYSGNAATGKDSTITVTNTKGLTLKKSWVDSNGDPLKVIPLTEVPINLYGTTANGTTEFIKQYTVSAPTWSLLIEDDLSQYVSFKAVEALESDKLYGYTISYIYNTNGAAGTIQIINKDNTPTEISVTVNKEWEDGNDNHSSDTIVVNVYQTTDPQSDGGVSLAAGGATPIYSNVYLNADNGWTMTWTELPYKNEDTGDRYYYYVVEEVVNDYKPVYSRIEKAASQSVTIKNIIPGKLTVNKLWQNMAGDAVTANTPESITLEVYRCLQKTQASEDSSDQPATTDTVKIMAMGDSITDGYQYSQDGYRKYFYHKLVDGIGYSIDMVGNKTQNNSAAEQSYAFEDGTFTYDAHNEGYSGYSIVSYGGRTGLYETINSSDTVKTNDPDIVLLMIGTNDILDTYDISNVQSRLETLVNEIFDQKSDVTLIIMSPPPIDSTVESWVPAQETANASINSCIEAIEEIVAAKKELGLSCEYVDINSLFNGKDDYTEYLEDYCHPNENGYKLMGEYLADVVHTYLRTGSVELDAVEMIEVPTNTNEFPSELTGLTLVGEYTVNSTTNWTLTLEDIEKTDASGNAYVYYVKEKDVDGWSMSGYNYTNGQLISNDGLTAITVTNTRIVPQLDFTVEKIWVDADNPERPAIVLRVHRSTDQINWEPYTEAIPELDMDGNKWTYTYTDLPGENDAGEKYYYKVVEDVPNGYVLSSETNNSVSVSSENRVIKLINTLSFYLTVQKDWADIDTNEHNDQVINVEIHGSTNLDDVPDDVVIIEPELALDPMEINLIVGEDGTVKLNKKITNQPTVYDTSVATAVLSEDGKSIIITARGAGQTTMDVKDSNDKLITVTIKVVAFNLTIDPAVIQAGQTAVLKPTMGGSPVTGATYTVETDGIVTINGDTITGVGIGKTKITASYQGETSTAEIEVVMPDDFTLEASSETVTAGEYITLTPKLNFGTFIYGQSSADGGVVEITTNADGTAKVTGVTEGTVTITATREGNPAATASVDITVLSATELYIYMNGANVTNSNVEIGLNQSVIFTTNMNIDSVTSDNNYHISFEKTGDRQFKVTGNFLAGWGIHVKVNGGTKYVNVYVVEAVATTTTTTESSSGETTTTTTTTNGSSSGESQVATGTNVSISTYDSSNPLIQDVTLKKLEFTFTYRQYGSTYIKYVTSNGTVATLLRPSFWDSGETVEDVNSSVGMSYSFTGTKLIVEFTNGLDVRSLYFEPNNNYGIETMSYTITYGTSATTTTTTLKSAASLTNRLSRAVTDSTYITSVELKASSDTKWTEVENLPVYDDSGAPYYYWIVETDVPGYKASYGYDDSDDVTADEDLCINAAAAGNAVATVKNTPTESGGVSMPSTGGSGTAKHYGIGLILISGSAAVYFMLKRRERKTS